jgi:hypothetical protein
LPLTCFLSSQPAVRYRPSLSLRLPMRCRRGCGELASVPDSPPTGTPWKLPKNELVVHPAISESTDFSRLYSVCFQSNAARPQAGDRKWCNLSKVLGKLPVRNRFFGAVFSVNQNTLAIVTQNSIVTNAQPPVLMQRLSRIKIGNYSIWYDRRHGSRTS